MCARRLFPALWSTLAAEGWLELGFLRLAAFVDVGLPFAVTDREVWEFAQTRDMVLLTGNRDMDGADSLEQTIRDEINHLRRPSSQSVMWSIVEKTYREECALCLVEIALYLDNYRGAGRLYIP